MKVSSNRPGQVQGVPGRLRPQIFLTFRHYKGGRSSAIRTGRLYPRRNPWYSFSEAESTSGHMVLSGEPRKKSPLTPPGIDSGTVRLVAQCLNHYATPGPSENEYQEYFLGVKAAGAWDWRSHHLHVPNAMKSGSLNLLEPSGPRRARYGAALPFNNENINVVQLVQWYLNSNWN